MGLGETPQDWRDLGLLSPAADQIVSDGEGRVVLGGWPRGTYRWRVERPGGAVAAGEFELGPGNNPAIELRLP